MYISIHRIYTRYAAVSFISSVGVTSEVNAFPTKSPQLKTTCYLRAHNSSLPLSNTRYAAGDWQQKKKRRNVYLLNKENQANANLCLNKKKNDNWETTTCVCFVLVHLTLMLNTARALQFGPPGGIFASVNLRGTTRNLLDPSLMTSLSMSGQLRFKLEPCEVKGKPKRCRLVE